MKYVVNLLLVLAIAALAYMLYNSIKEPIAFGDAKTKRVNAVVDKLKKIRTAQELYRGMHGDFAGSFDSLAYHLKNGKIEFVKLEDDPNDPDPEKFIRTVSYSPAIDTVRALGLGNLDSLRYVPYADGEEFFINADMVTYQQTLVSVVEVGTKYNKFMGQYADTKYQKYDGRYEPQATIKFGDMTKPSLSGNWE